MGQIVDKKALLITLYIDIKIYVNHHRHHVHYSRDMAIWCEVSILDERHLKEHLGVRQYTETSD